MAQGLFAGGTSYENQSLTDILLDLEYWVKYSENVKNDVQQLFEKAKSTPFYKSIPYDYLAIIHEILRICQTNVEDIRIVIAAIDSHALTKAKVELLRKISARARQSSEDNRRCFKNQENGYWHDYGNPDFDRIESIYRMFGDYCATLLDASNAAHRLNDYVDIPEEVTTMKIENNNVNIGNKNNLKKSSFFNKTTTNGENNPKESFGSRFFWVGVMGVLVILVGEILLRALKLK